MSASSAPGCGAAAGAAGLADERLDPHDREHPLRADERARDLVDGLGGDTQRDHEEGGIAVEGDELARADAARRSRAARRAT